MDREIDIVPTGDGWAAKQNGRTVRKSDTKDPLVKQVAGDARSSSKSTSVRIHKQDGTFQEERTYPRSADPTKSKG